MKWSYLKYFPGECYAYNKNNEIIGTVSPDGVFKRIGSRRIPSGQKRARI